DMKECCQKDIDNRLASVEGHIKGVRQMVADDKPCEDIMMQLSAISAAIDKTNKLIMENHIRHCVKDGIENGDFEVIDRLVEVIEKYK
ncbi:MAG: metal-sensitive transcriptional regulator, partial [Clostridia bacterium]